MFEKVGAVMGYGGSGAAVASGVGVVVFGLTPTQWSAVGVIGGLVIGLLGFLVNVYFGWRRLRLDQERQAKVTSTHQE